MKVLLISSNTATSPYPVYPLGLSMVAASVRKAGHEILLFDSMHAGSPEKELVSKITSADPDVAGISVRNIDNVNMMHEERYIDRVVEIVRCIRRHSRAKIVLGGPAFSILPERIMEATRADYGIVGEGETAFTELLEAGAGGDWPPAGTILRGEGWLDPAEIPSALYDEQLLAKYLSQGSVASVQTKRGCPLNCVYCSYPALEGAAIRARDPKRIVRDIEVLKEKHGASFLFFTDSVFNDDEGTYLEVLEEMRRRNVKINWSAFFKPSGITPEIVQLMVETGLQAAELGSDAACDATLRGQMKSFEWRDVLRTNDAFRDAGIALAHYFMFGGPGETRDTVLEGINNIRSLDCSAAFVFMGIRILPDTRLHDIARRENILPENHDLLEPVYYISPDVERDWLEKTLTASFKPLRHVLFPPDMLDDKLQLLHKLGHKGALWDLLRATPAPQRKSARNP